MLFDIRGRRRTGIRWIYGVVAAVMGVGFVGFGVGSDVGAGLFNAGHGDGGGQTRGVSLDDQREALRARVDRNPRDAGAWRRLSLLEASAAVDQGDGHSGGARRSDDAGARLEASTTAYERYRRLAGNRRVDPPLAVSAARAYAALGMSGEAVAAQRLAVRGDAAGPNGWLDLGRYAAANRDVGLVDRALGRAAKLAPRDEREAIRSQRAALMRVAVEDPDTPAGSEGAQGDGG